MILTLIRQISTGAPAMFEACVTCGPCDLQLHGVWWIYLLGHVIGAFLGAGVSCLPDPCAMTLGPCV